MSLNCLDIDQRTSQDIGLKGVGVAKFCELWILRVLYVMVNCKVFLKGIKWPILWAYPLAGDFNFGFRAQIRVSHALISYNRHLKFWFWERRSGCWLTQQQWRHLWSLLSYCCSIQFVKYFMWYERPQLWRDWLALRSRCLTASHGYIPSTRFIKQQRKRIRPVTWFKLYQRHHPQSKANIHSHSMTATAHLCVSFTIRSFVVLTGHRLNWSRS